MVHRAIALAAGVGLWASAASAQCNVILVATGTYQLEVRSGGPFPVVDFKKATTPIFEFHWRGNRRQCDQAADATAAEITKSRNASDLMFQLTNDLRAAAWVNWGPGGSAAQRTAESYPYRDFAALAGVIRADALVVGLRKLVADVAADLIKRYANPAGYFTDKGAKWIAERAVEMMLQEYVEGRDPGLIIDGQLGRMVDYLKTQAGSLTQGAGGPALDAALKELLNRIAKDLKALIVEKQPTEQWVRAETSTGPCTHALHVSWDLHGGRYRATLTIRCGPQQPDAIGLIVVTAPSVKPGQGSTVTVQALNQLGVPFPLSDATITGLAAVMPDGSTEPAAMIAPGGRAASFVYTAALPRKDGKYALTVNVVTDNSTGLLAGVHRAEVVVENVAPVIESVTPGAASAEPGDRLDLRGARVLVVDDNADAGNGGEVSERSLTIAHPAGLRTTPLFDRADNPRRVSFDAANGRYVFEFDRAGLVAEPHEHGTWSAAVTMSDVDGEMATSSVDLEVEDTPPLVARITASPKYLHSGDGKTISVTARYTDKNGVDDILALAIDARAAGGGRWTLANGLRETGRGPDWIEVEVVTPFGHPDPPGRYDITTEVRDDATTTPGSDFIMVGNETPLITGTGFVWGVFLTPVGQAAVVEAPQKDLCPNDPFRVGLILSDLEGDALTATATIVETGQSVELVNTSDNVWIAEMTAPPAPGTYTLRFEGKENPPYTKSATKTHMLTVHPCAGSNTANAILDGTAVNPDDIADAPRDPTSQIFFGAFGGTTVAPANPGGGDPDAGSAAALAALFDEIAAAIHPSAGPSADLAPGASVSGSPAQAPEVEAYLLALGGSTGPVVQFFAVNGSGRTIRLPAAGLVLEPVRITPAAQARITTVLQRVLDRGGAPATVNAYCLEFLRQPPAAGTVLRIAGDALQQQFARHRRVLDAASRLRELGRLAADSDPEDYFHAIRQWAVWTVEERFDAKRFEDAFVEVTHRNYQAAGEAWTTEVEQALRSLAPNRWNDVQAVLREAGLGAG